MRWIPVARTPGLGAILAAVVCIGCSGERGPDTAEKHLRAGDAFLAENRAVDALAEYEKAASLDPDRPDARIRIASVRVAQERLDEATEIAQSVLEQHPESAEAHALWGSILFRRGVPQEGYRECEKAFGLDPSSSRVLLSWANALVRFRRDEEAVSILERVEKREGELPADALADWGTALERLGRSDEAMAKYEMALEVDPDDFLAVRNLGDMLARRSDAAARERGFQLLQSALRLRPGNPGALHRLGRAYLEEGRFQEAHNLLQRAVAATDPSLPAYEERSRDLERARAGLPHRAADADAPDILLIVVDTLRSDHMGVYGYERNTTPRIDSLATRSVVFESAISQAPWTAPSVASLLTGLYPSVHGLDGGIYWAAGLATAGGTLPFAIQKTLSSSQMTLAEALRRSGYRTAGFVSNVYVNSIFGFAQGFETYDDEHAEYSQDVLKAKRRGDDTNRRVFEWLANRRPEPFFLLVHYNDCHWPYDPPAPFGRDYIAGYRGSLTPEKTGTIVETQGKPITDLSRDDLQYIIGLYDGEISYADSNVGKLLDRIRSVGLERDLLTVLVADHGEEFLDHGAGSHGFTLYEEQIRVPLILHCPGRLPARRIGPQVRLIDVMPTILELAGVDGFSTDLQGRSLLPLIDGETTTGPGNAFSEATYVEHLKSIRTEDGLKLIEDFTNGRSRLFDLGSDPKETTDLLAGNPSLASPLRKHLDDWKRANELTRTELYGEGEGDQEVVLDAETQERLRALGYIR